MAEKRAAYRIVLRGRKGFAKIRYANSFELWYGRRRIVVSTPFPVRVKTVKQKTAFLKKLIAQIEAARQKVLEKRRRAYKRKKLEQDLKRAKIYAKRRIARPVSRDSVEVRAITKPVRVLSEEEELYLENQRESQRQLLAFNKLEAEEPPEEWKEFVKDEIVIPVEPDGRKYVKRVYDKSMNTLELGNFHLAILDMKLDDDAQISMSTDNFKEAYVEAVNIFLPSILDYFQQVKNSSRFYILRLQFKHWWDPDGKPADYGISWVRTELRDANGLIQLFKLTFEQLFGGNDRIGYKTVKGKFRTNYLEGEKPITITGISLEAADVA